jgi:hypothetical protein
MYTNPKQYVLELPRPDVKLTHRRREMKEVVRYSEAFKRSIVEKVSRGSMRDWRRRGGRTVSEGVKLW